MNEEAYHGTVRQDIVPLVPRGERLIDIGGGYGATALELKRLGRCRVAGVVDLVAPEQAGDLDFSVRTDLANQGLVAAIADEHGPFDTVLCLDILEHLVAPELLLADISRALRPNGRLIVSIPNVRHVSVVLPLLRGHWTYGESGVLDSTHLRFYTRASARRLIEGAGFEIDWLQPTGMAKRWQRLVNLLSLGQLRDFFALQYFILARPKGAR